MIVGDIFTMATDNPQFSTLASGGIPIRLTSVRLVVLLLIMILSVSP